MKGVTMKLFAAALALTLGLAGCGPVDGDPIRSGASAPDSVPRQDAVTVAQLRQQAEQNGSLAVVLYLGSVPERTVLTENLIMSEDIQFQIECLSTELVEMLMHKYGWNMKKALDELYSSETYKRLCNPACGLYYEGAVYVFSYLENEIETGVIN